MKKLFNDSHDLINLEARDLLMNGFSYPSHVISIMKKSNNCLTSLKMSLD